MSETVEGYKVPVTSILELREHPNAHSLSIARVYGWEVVVKKDFYKVGDRVILVPIDSILPSWLENKLFDASSKIKLHHSRIRQIKIRGFPSQGMLLSTDDVKEKVPSTILEQDLAELLGITKYEPKSKESTPRSATLRNKPKENVYFHKYGGVQNLKWYPDLFKQNDFVVVQEKLHGTNARYGLLPNKADTIWKKIKKFFGKLPANEFTYGSNNVQLQSKSYTGYYPDNVYKKMADELKIASRLRPGETIFGEIIGPGVQRGYAYGIPNGSHKLVVFDVKVFDGETSKYLEPEAAQIWCLEREFEFVPVLYKGLWDYSIAKNLSKGASHYATTEPVREGIVIKANEGYNDSILSKKALKLINEDYLNDTTNSDEH